MRATRKGLSRQEQIVWEKIYWYGHIRSIVLKRRWFEIASPSGPCKFCRTIGTTFAAGNSIDGYVNACTACFQAIPAVMFGWPSDLLWVG